MKAETTATTKTKTVRTSGKSAAAKRELLREAVMTHTVSAVVGPATAGKIDPDAEKAYWRLNFSKRRYVDPGVPFETYQLAYRIGYMGRGLYPGQTFDQAEAVLAKEYERSRGTSGLAWGKAKQATQDAWYRVGKALSA
jgi:hypothetical protein